MTPFRLDRDLWSRLRHPVTGLTVSMRFVAFGGLPLIGCGEHQPKASTCDSAPWAMVGDQPILALDVSFVRAQVRLAGGSMGVRDALVDCVLQEQLRQHTGLPGGADVRFQRMKSIRTFRGTRHSAGWDPSRVWGAPVRFQPCAAARTGWME